MLTEGLAARRAKKSELEHALLDAHDRTWAILEDLAPEQWQVPYDPGINPPRWEFGHVAWFTEWWVLREAHWNERDEIVTRHRSQDFALRAFGAFALTSTLFRFTLFALFALSVFVFGGARICRAACRSMLRTFATATS